MELTSLIQNPQGWGDNICNQCITILENLSDAFGISYGTLNVLLFVIIQPLLIVIFMGTTIYCCVRKTDIKTKKQMFLGTMAVFGICIIFSCILFYPIILSMLDAVGDFICHMYIEP